VHTSPCTSHPHPTSRWAPLPRTCQRQHAERRDEASTGHGTLSPVHTSPCASHPHSTSHWAPLPRAHANGNMRNAGMNLHRPWDALTCAHITMCIAPTSHLTLGAVAAGTYQRQHAERRAEASTGPGTFKQMHTVQCSSHPHPTSRWAPLPRAHTTPLRIAPEALPIRSSSLTDRVDRASLHSRAPPLLPTTSRRPCRSRP
jgi:hypothetical protein